MAKANSPEQTVGRARLDLPVPVTGRGAGRGLRFAGRPLDQSRGSATFGQADRGRASHHLDARTLPRRVERLLEQRQDQPDVLPHRVLQRGHLAGQLVYPRVYLFHGSARSALKVACKREERGRGEGEKKEKKKEERRIETYHQSVDSTAPSLGKFSNTRVNSSLSNILPSRILFFTYFFNF